MGPVQGKNAILYFSDGGPFEEYGCAESFSLEMIAELIEVTTKSHGYSKAYDYQSKDYTLNLTGITQNEDIDKKTVWYFVSAQSMFIDLFFRAVYTDDGAVAKTVSGRVLVPRIMIDSNQTDFATSTISLQGSGPALVQDGIITDVEITLTAQGHDGTTGSIDTAELDDGAGNIYDLLPGGALTTTAYPGVNSTTISVPSGTYILRIQVTTSALMGSMEAHTLGHDASPGVIVHPPPSATTDYYDDDPIWDFTEARTISLTTGFS